MTPARMGFLDKFEARPGAEQDSILELRVELVDSEPAIWRLFELRSSMALSQVHQVNMTASFRTIRTA